MYLTTPHAPQHLADQLDLKDRRYMFSTYPCCAVGREIVDFLINFFQLSSRAVAVELGQALIKRWVEIFGDRCGVGAIGW